MRWVQRRDRRGRFHTLPYQAAPSPPMTPALSEACDRAVHVITADGRVLRAGRACLAVAEETGYRLPARLLALPPFIWLVEGVYRLVAANRRLFSRVLFREEDEEAHPPSP